jgi:hypothetical protein
MKRFWIVLGLVPAFVSCSHSEATVTDGGAQAPTPVAVAGVSTSRALRLSWADAPAGAPPAQLVDVRADGHSYPWLYDGGWRVASSGGSAVLSVPFALTVPREPLSFRRYDGNAFGPGGTLPMRYRIEAEARSLGGSTRFNGYGEVAVQVAYLSPVSYVEVLQTDQHLMLWEARNAPPMQGKGWRQLAKVPNPRAVGAWVRFGAEVDRHSGRITAYLDGKPVASAQSSLLAANQRTRFTLRATGNKEEWRWVTVNELP